MQKFILSLLALYFAIAQIDRYKLTIGGTLGKFVGDHTNTYSYAPGLTIGASFWERKPQFSINYEIQLSVIGSRYSDEINLYGKRNIDVSEYLVYLEVPVLIHYAINKKFSFFAGPSFGLRLTNFSTDDPYYNALPEAIDTRTSEISPIKLSTEIGINYKLANHNVSLSYSKSLTNLTKFTGIDFKSSVIRFKLYYSI